MRIISGIQPSGNLHIGNYFGMMRPCLELQDQGEMYLFIADYHALTQVPDPTSLNERITNVAIDFLACGLDPEKTVFFRHSDISEVTELAWIIGCVTPFGLIERCHSYKDKVGRGIVPNFGLFSYPVLMAADILLYKADLVPVGKDQKQHLEVTRDIALRFNNQYGDLLVIPKELTRQEVALVPGIDGQKMSKSYDNTIEIFGNEKLLRKKIMKIVTDSTPVDEPKNPDRCNVFALYKLVANKDEIRQLRERYMEGGMGYGHAKQDLFEKFWEFFRPMRKLRDELANNPDHIQKILERGSEQAKSVASENLREIKNAVGLS